ncbi:MAG: hypothetical protein ABR885_14090, partial [Mycobacterium sp.]
GLGSVVVCPKRPDDLRAEGVLENPRIAIGQRLRRQRHLRFLACGLVVRDLGALDIENLRWLTNLGWDKKRESHLHRFDRDFCGIVPLDHVAKR